LRPAPRDAPGRGVDLHDGAVVLYRPERPSRLRDGVTFAKPSLPVSTPLRGSIRSLPSGIVNLRAAQTASVPTASRRPPPSATRATTRFVRGSILIRWLPRTPPTFGAGLAFGERTTAPGPAAIACGCLLTSIRAETRALA
jgi:hypothetical protein